MSVYVASAAVARTNFNHNAGSRWHRAGAAADDNNGTLAFQRLRRPLFEPVIRPGFKIRADDKLFAIGSCFARGIERSLLHHNFDVVSAAPEFAALQPANKEMTGLGFTNKYNTFSIYNELRWALDPTAEFPRDSIVEVDGGLFWDPHITGALEPAGRDETFRRREMIQMVTRRVAECRVVFMTLGLGEVWRDTATDTFLNTGPTADVVRRYPNRYEFHVTGYARNLANLEELHALLSRFGHPDVRIVVTVSPVPLMATFSPDDVVSANTYSKAMLRTVAQEWAAAHSNVDYFPSFEVVQNSDRAIAWSQDARHVEGKVVNHIMAIFRKHYVEA